MWFFGAIMLCIAAIAARCADAARRRKAKATSNDSVAHVDRALAIHEAGHIVAAWASTVTVSIDYATIGGDDAIRLEPGVGGRVQYETRICNDGVYDGHRLWCLIVFQLAGIAAEAAHFESVRTGGSSNDLGRAYALAEMLAARGTTSPPWTQEVISRRLPFSEILTPPPTRREIDILDAAYGAARSLVTGWGGKFDRLVNDLIEKRTLREDDIARVLGSRWSIKWLGGKRATIVMPRGTARRKAA